MRVVYYACRIRLCDFIVNNYHLREFSAACCVFNNAMVIRYAVY